MSRASPRYPVRLAATVHVEKARGSADDMLICRTRNISEEGCLLDTSHAFEAGTGIAITIMDDQTGDAISMSGWVARAIDAPSGGERLGIGVRIAQPPRAWLALVERQSKRRATTQNPDADRRRRSIVVVGDEDRQRGALALYVTSGWDVRFANDFSSAREALSSGAIDALVAEHDIGDERWPTLMELARELQPRARRLVRTRMADRHRQKSGFRNGLVHRFVDYDAGIDALFDALTAPFDPRPERDATSLQVRLMGLEGGAKKPTPLSAPPLPSDKAHELLTQVLRDAAGAAPRGIVVFDLDSTIIDNRPRQAKIMREYGAAHDLPALARCAPEHWQSWNVRVAMENAGLDKAAIDEHEAKFRAFWLERFFTSEYCAIDRPITGAPAFVTAAAQTGSRVVYVTGRPERMREGTVQSFGPAGFPAPDGDRIQLVMKPSFDEGDDAYKTRAHTRLRDLGAVIAVFDNEPTHINDYARAFPDAISIHLATDHSPRPVRVADGIPSIRDFSAYSAPALPRR